MRFSIFISFEPIYCFSSGCLFTTFPPNANVLLAFFKLHIHDSYMNRIHAIGAPTKVALKIVDKFYPLQHQAKCTGSINTFGKFAETK